MTIRKLESDERKIIPAMIRDTMKKVGTLIKLNQRKQHCMSIKKVWKRKPTNEKSIEGLELFVIYFACS